MNLTESNLLIKVSDFLKEIEVPNGSTIVIGLSGGPDSVALLLALHSLKEDFDLNLHAAYVNHGMRDVQELKQEDSFVDALVRSLGITLHTHHIEHNKIIDIAKIESRSNEEVARELRYSFFDNILNHYSQSYLALGHNLDDQFETMITRFFQGSGISGLKGIPHINDSILRPLIHCRKKEIISFLQEHDQKYLIDPTNMKNDYLRNQVRNKLIPIIQDIFPGYGKALQSLEKVFIEQDEFQKNEMKKIQINFLKSKCEISINNFNDAHIVIKKKLLYEMFDYTYIGYIKSLRVPEGFFNSLLFSKLENGRTYAMAYGVKFYVKDNVLTCESTSKDEMGFYFILNDMETVIPEKYIVLINESQDIKLEVKAGSPLIFRSVEANDYIEVNNRDTSLKSIFETWKMSDSQKKMIPVISDSLGIIAILGEIHGYKNIFRNKKINSSEKFNILYLGVRNILQE